MGNTVVSESIAAKLFCIRIEHHLVTARRHQESVVCITTRRREVEYEDKVATHVAQYLITVIVPNFRDRCCLEVLLRFNDLKHLLVEVTQPMVAQILIINKVPLTTSILV